MEATITEVKQVAKANHCVVAELFLRPFASLAGTPLGPAGAWDRHRFTMSGLTEQQVRQFRVGDKIPVEVRDS